MSKENHGREGNLYMIKIYTQLKNGCLNVLGFLELISLARAKNFLLNEFTR